MLGSGEGQLLPKGWESRIQGWPCAGCALADRDQSRKGWTQGQSWGQVTGSIDMTSDEQVPTPSGQHHLGAKGGRIRERWRQAKVQGWGVYPGDRDRDRDSAADQDFYSVAGAGTDGPGAEMKWSPRSMYRGGQGSQVMLLMPLWLWQDVMNSPLRDLSSDIDIVVTQPGCVTYWFFKHIEHDSFADTAF